MDRINEYLRGRDNAGLRRIVREAAFDQQQGIGYDSPEAITRRIGRKVALTATGRANVLAALTALMWDCYENRMEEVPHA